MSTARNVRAGGAFIEVFIKDRVQAGIKTINRQLLSFAAKAGLAGAAVGAAGFAILRPLVSAGKEFAEFDRRLRAAAAASELTSGQMEQLGEEIKKVSQRSGTVLIDLADETVELARALGKVDPSELANLADVIAQLSKASGDTLGISRTGLLSTIGAFGLKNSQAKDVANLLIKGANSSQASLSDFVFTLKTLAPVSKAAGISLQTTIALAAGLSTIGIKGEEAGTQLRRLAIDVTANTKELEKSFGIIIPKGSTFLNVLELLSEATAGDNVSTRADKFNKAFGLLGITSALGIGTTAEQIKEFQKSFVDVSGELQKQFDKIQGGLGGGFDRMSSSLQVLRVTVGGALEDLFGRFADGVQAINAVISPFIKNNKEAVQVIALVGVAAIVTSVSLLLMSGAAVALSLVLGALSSILLVLQTPLGLIAAVVLSNIVFFGLLGAAFLTFTKTGNTLARSLGSGIIYVFRQLKKTAKEVLAVVTLTMEGISLSFQNGNLEAAATIAFQGIKIAGIIAFRDLSKVVDAFFTRVQLGLLGLGAGLGLNASILKGLLAGLAGVAGGSATSALSKELAKAQKELQDLVDKQKKNAADPKLGDSLGKAIDEAVGGIPNGNGIEKGIQGMVSSSFDSTRGLIKGQKNSSAEQLKSIAGSARETADVLRNGVVTVKLYNAGVAKRAKAQEKFEAQFAAGWAEEVGNTFSQNKITTERASRLRELSIKERERQDRVDAQKAEREASRADLGLATEKDIAQRKKDREAEKAQRLKDYTFPNNRKPNEPFELIEKPITLSDPNNKPKAFELINPEPRYSVQDFPDPILNVKSKFMEAYERMLKRDKANEDAKQQAREDARAKPPELDPVSRAQQILSSTGAQLKAKEQANMEGAVNALDRTLDYLISKEDGGKAVDPLTSAAEAMKRADEALKAKLDADRKQQDELLMQFFLDSKKQTSLLQKIADKEGAVFV